MFAEILKFNVIVTCSYLNVVSLTNGGDLHPEIVLLQFMVFFHELQKCCWQHIMSHAYDRSFSKEKLKF